jgi:hypothetical protein
MSNTTNKCKHSNFFVSTVLKRKFKQYLANSKYSTFIISSTFPKFLVHSLKMVLEEIMDDCIKYVKKNETSGLSAVDNNIILMVLNENNKYDFILKYSKKYNATIKYNDSILFNYELVVDNFESERGNKLMIDPEARNYVSYLLLSLQYDLIKLSLIMIVFANKKTLSKDSFLASFDFLLNEMHLNEMHSKITLKLDSMSLAKSKTDADDEDEEDSEQNEDVKEEPVKEEPVKEETVKEEPVKEETVKEEPVKEEPVKEEPVKEERVKEERVKNENVVIEQEVKKRTPSKNSAKTVKK